MSITEEISNLIAKSKELRSAKDNTAEKYADEAYEKAKQISNTSLMLQAKMEKAFYYLNVKPDFNKTEELTQEILATAEVHDNIDVLTAARNVLGISYDVKGNYMDARSCYLDNITLLENTPNLSRDLKNTLGNAYHNLSKLYQQVETVDTKVDYLDKAVSLFESIEENSGLARIWNLKASMLPSEAPIEQRLELFKTALAYFEKGTEIVGHTLCIGNVGLCYCHLGEYEKGVNMLKDAYRRILKTNTPPHISFTLFQLGEALRMKGDHEEAITHLQEAEKVLLEANGKVYLNVIYQEWATNLAALGRFEEAYEKMHLFMMQVHERLQFDRQSAEAEARLKFELEKKEKEAALIRKRNEEIELYNEKLRQSNDELNQFAYVASHDLKEPLRMVSNYIQLLEKSFSAPLSDDQSTYVRYVNEGAKRMYKLIDSLLVFSRATMDPELKLINLNDVVDEVERVVLSTSTKEVNIIADELPSVLGDHSQMLQLLQNLVSNAVKYNDKSPVEIRISYVPEPRAHRIVIEDNGIGIAPQYREKVFEIFKRLHNRETYSGTGIGLSICKKIVHRLNGKIWIEDSALGGSAFIFTIPKRSITS